MAAIDKKGIPLAVTPWWHSTLARVSGYALVMVAVYLFFARMAWMPFRSVILQMAAILLASLLEWFFYGRYLSALKRRLREFQLAICLRCAYDLHGLPENHSCPECGESFALSDTREHWRKWLSKQFHPTFREYINLTSNESCIHCGAGLERPGRFLCKVCGELSGAPFTWW